MNNAFIASLANEPLFFMGDYERAVGWSWENGWVCPSNDHVDLYTRKQVMGGRVTPPNQPGNWKWIEYQDDSRLEAEVIDPKDIPNVA